ncbi:hypothetical protein PENTCL1PPCAC_9480, partial [Pristionchus entomophagus]
MVLHLPLHLHHRRLRRLAPIARRDEDLQYEISRFGQTGAQTRHEDEHSHRFYCDVTSAGGRSFRRHDRAEMVVVPSRRHLGRPGLLGDSIGLDREYDHQFRLPGRFSTGALSLDKRCRNHESQRRGLPSPPSHGLLIP